MRVSLINDHSSFVKSPFLIYLKAHVGLLPFHFLKMGDIYLDNDNIVNNPSVREEACLIRPNNGGDERLHPVKNDFGHQFIAIIAKHSGPIVFEMGCIGEFKGKTQEGGIHVFRHLATGKHLLTKRGGPIPNLLQEFLVEHGVETIWSRSFKGLEGFQSNVNFSVFKGGI